MTVPLHGVGEARPAFATLVGMWDHAADTLPGTVALRRLDAAVTYAEERRAAAAFAGHIAAVAPPGETIALLLPNSAEFRTAYLAALMARVVPALLNPLYPPAQLEPLLRLAGPRLIVCAPATRALGTDLAQRLGAAVICLGDDFTLAQLAQAPVPAMVAPAPDDVAALLFTGGTSGLSKAVAHTHARLLMATRLMEWAWPTRAQGEVWLPIAPFTHIYGFLSGVLAPVHARATVVIPERFRPEPVVDLLASERVTVFGGGPPALYAALLAAPNLGTADLSALRVCCSGGAPFPVEMMERWRRVTGRAVHEGYGMTEMAPIAASNDLTGLRPGSVGKAVPGVTIEIVDLRTGTEIQPPGTPGEVRIRGAHMMTGYHGNPAETAATLRDGHIYTGDIGHLDPDGFLFITDRKKDVVFVKGFNVYPRQVEEVLYAHPQLAGAGVVGMADPRTGGERLVAFVVARPGEAIDPAQVAAYCAGQLVGHACPADIRVVEALPVTAAQKLDRVTLRRLA